MIDPTDMIMGRIMTTVDNALKEGADYFYQQLYTAIGVQAPLFPGSPPRASERAGPWALPRRVSGRLQALLHVQREATAVYTVGVRKGDMSMVAKWLEYGTSGRTAMTTPHPFFGVTLQGSLSGITAIVAERCR